MHKHSGWDRQMGLKKRVYAFLAICLLEEDQTQLVFLQQSCLSCSDADVTAIWQTSTAHNTHRDNNSLLYNQLTLIDLCHPPIIIPSEWHKHSCMLCSSCRRVIMSPSAGGGLWRGGTYLNHVTWIDNGEHLTAPNTEIYPKCIC